VASIALAAAENQINLVHVDQALAAVKAVAVAEVGTWIVLDRVRGIGMVLYQRHADCGYQDTNRE
jgi:50S ribosomal subunit-associated GTPase HflX